MALRQLQSLVNGLHRDRVKSRKQKQRLNNRRALSERLEDRRMLAGPELIAIRPDTGALLRDGDVLNVAPREFNLLFQGGANLDEATINSNSVRLIRSGGDGLFDGVNDVAVRLGYVGLVNPGSTDPLDRQQIVIRPASSAAFNSKSLSNQFPDDLYQIQIVGSGTITANSPLQNEASEAFNDGVDFVSTFRLDRGAQVVSVVPQPVTRSGGVLTQATNQIDVYFDNQRLDSADAVNVNFYRLVNAVTLAPSSTPTAVAYDPVANKATLTFASIPEGSYRLDIGRATDTDPTIDNQGPLGTADTSSSFDTSLPLGSAGTATIKISGTIEPQSIPLPPLPGGEDDPGHRTIQREFHVASTGTLPTLPAEIRTVEYYFPLSIGTFDTSAGPNTGVYLNLITETEKQIVRDVLEIYAKHSGIEFIENQGIGGLSIGKGDLRALDEFIGPNAGVDGLGGPGAVVLNGGRFNQSSRFYGDEFTVTMYHEIGHALGLGHSYDQPSAQGAGPPRIPVLLPNEVLPGNVDLLHFQRITPPNSTDIDMYSFTLATGGRLNAEIFAERLTLAKDGVEPSLLNSALAIYQRSASGEFSLVARNDQYFGADAFLDLQLSAGEYFIGVSSTGNTSYDPNVPNSGFGGTTDGDYQLTIQFEADTTTLLRDTRGTALDGDADGTPGGVFQFWFQSAAPGNTFFVDKLADTNSANTNQGSGTLASPFESITQGLAAAAARVGTSVTSPTIVRIVGNSGPDGNLNTLADNRPYLIGTTLGNTPLADGAEFRVPAGVNVIVDAGTLIKLRKANIDAGSSSAGINRAGGSIQVFGTPTHSVFLRSYHDDTVGGNSDGVGPGAASGDFGGIVFRDDSDREANGIFLNHVNHADIKHGGGKVFVDSNELPFTSIHITNARPTVSYNLINLGNTAAISASPDSFDDSIGRIGPDVHGNYLVSNSIDGLFVRIDTPLGSNTTKLRVSGRFDDTDITHVLSENLIIAGGSGGPVRDALSVLHARPAGRLQIDPGIVVKLNKSRIEAERGAASLIAEGTVDRPIVFTSQTDKRYGGSGSFDTNRSPSTAPVPGDWGGIFFSEATSGSIDQAIITFGGGNSPIEGSDFAFNAVEIHQADVRIANSLIQNNAATPANSVSNRNGRGSNGIASIYVRGAQPIIINNTIQDNVGSPVDINANSLTANIQRDRGRSTGLVNAFTDFDDNYGPLVRLNRVDDNSTGVVGGGVNGMVVRGEEVTVESVWDDTDIVHVVFSEITVDNLHSLGGLTLQSSNVESLVVKFLGADAGFTATGTPAEIVDRVGGTIHVIGTPGHPVVLTSLNDCTVGAGFTPSGVSQTETFGSACSVGTGGGPPPVATGPLTITSTTNDGNALRDALLGPGVAAVGNATFVGSATSAGTFTGGGTSIGIESGIVLSSGPIDTVAGPNTSDSSSGIASGNGDAQLNAAFGVTTTDATTLTFDFTSTGGDLFFNFVFASEEYNEFANGNFNDVFAFFLDGVNIALIPGTTTPVSINSVNGGNPFGTNAVNPQFFNNNDPSNAGGFLADFGMDGFTDVFTATAAGLGAGTHTIKLAVSDVGDSSFNSAVFLQLGSFSDQPVVGSPAVSGDWRGLLFDEFSNDRNVAIVRELENPLTNKQSVNGTPSSAQSLGVLAPNIATPANPVPGQKAGDENRRLGFEVHGYISPDDGNDVDVYSFKGTAGTPVWIDLDRTDSTLDAVVEVIDATTGLAVIDATTGLVARSVGPEFGVNTLTQNQLLGGDYYSQNFRDPGFYYVLPGTVGSEVTYFVRVSSNPASVPAGNAPSRGKYQLQIRTQQVDEFPGSTVRFADIRFAATGIDIQGLPAHSPLLGEAGEVETAPNNTFGTAQTLVNLLRTDAAAIGISGRLANETDVDWYEFELTQTDVQAIPGVNSNPGTIGVVFDIDYADGAVSADTTIAVYDQNQRLVYIGRESNIEDDQRPDGVLSINDLSRGSLAKKDGYIGPIHLTPGLELPLSSRRYYVAVMSNRQQPSALDGVFTSTVNPETARVRLEPVNSVVRIVEDHIGFQGYSSNNVAIRPRTTGGLFNINNPLDLASQIQPLTLGDVTMYVATDVAGTTGVAGVNDSLYTFNPYTGGQYVTRVATSLAPGFDDVQDIVIRTDGRMFGYQRLSGNAGSVGALVELNPEDGQILSTQNDNIQGPAVPNSTDFNRNISSSNNNSVNHTFRANQFTLSDDVDAFTFERRTTTGPTSAPIPVYDVYYSVRESDTASKLYRATGAGDATPSVATAPIRYGFLGDIQPPGVTIAQQTLQVRQPVNMAPDNVTDIRLESRVAGAAGNFTIDFDPRPNNTVATVSDVDLATRTITLRIGLTTGPAAPDAAAIVAAINNHVDASKLVTAVIVGGSPNANGDGANGTPAINISTTTTTVGANGPIGPLKGRVTGLSFGGFNGTGNSTGPLYGVTDAGEFLIINKDTGLVNQVIDAGNTIGIPNLNFQGLTLGPQNVENSAHKNTLFAVTGDGQIVAFNAAGNGVVTFDSGSSSQLVTVAGGSPNNAGFFTLTSDVGGFGRHTTDPIAFNAPSTVSLNESQDVDTDADGGTFTLSLVDDQGGITSPSADITAVATVIPLEVRTDFPRVDFPTTFPFVIQIDDEQMRVNGGTPDSYNVTRGWNGTTATAHDDTDAVFEVVSTSLNTGLATPVSTTVDVDLNNQAGSTTLTVASPVFPAAPFTIRVDNEEMRVTAVDGTGTVLTVQRQQNGTPITHHNAGRIVTLVSDQITVVDFIPLRLSQRLRIGSEDLRIVGPVTGNVINVIRGANGTTPVSHSSGSTVNKLDTTGPIAFNATAGQVQTALSLLPSVGFGNVLVTNGPLSGFNINPATIVFQGTLKGKDLQPLTADVTRLVGDEIQTIALDPLTVRGEFRLDYLTDTTDYLPYDATAAMVQAALEALPSIGAGNVIVSGPDLPAGPLTVQFVNELQDLDVAPIVVNVDSVPRNEIQRIAFTGNPVGGQFRLSLSDPNVGTATTGNIAFDATATTVQNTLIAALPGLAGNINVTGGQLPGTPVTIEFVNELAGLDIALIAVFSSTLAPGSASVNVTTTQAVPDPPQNEVQSITLTGAPGSGNFTISISDSVNGINGTSDPIAFDADDIAVNAALIGGIPSLLNNISVSGGSLPGTPISIEFIGRLARRDVAEFTLNSSTLPVPADVVIATDQLAPRTLVKNEQQQIVLTGAATGGTFTLSLADSINGITGTSNPIAWDAGPLAVRNALENGIPELFGNIAVTGSVLPAGPITIEFINEYAGADIAKFTFASTLAPAAASVAISVPVNNVSPAPTVTTQRDGRSVSVPITTTVNGIMSVFDALDALPNFDVTNVRAAGDLESPGVTVSFIGGYAGFNIPPFDVNNDLMEDGTTATVTVTATVGDGLNDSFIATISGYSSFPNSGNQRPIGLAFSPFDFNLWHPTTRRSTDVGHGVGTVIDGSRTPGDVNVNYGSANEPNRQFNQVQGGASLYFGFEPWLQTANNGTESYLRYTSGTNAQYGITTTAIHQDLSSNPVLASTYNMPGGAFGALKTKSFDLTTTVASDRPTLYFSYFLDTEDHAGSTVSSDVNNPFRDSARVWASRDGLPADDPNKVWELLATNNSQLSAADTLNVPGTAELGGFLSHLSDAGLSSAAVRPEAQQIRQELFDNTGQWRQARVDLSTYAGVADVQLRFDFSSSGAMNDPTLGSIDSSFGEYSSETRSIRSLDNEHEGFYIDDIIIGYAERGEMVTGAGGDPGITDLNASNRTGNADPRATALILSGPYQLEIRRTGEYQSYNPANGTTNVSAIYDTNDQHIIDVAEVASFDFEDGTFPGTTTSVPGFLVPWAVTNTRPHTGSLSLESGAVGPNELSRYQVTTAAMGAALTQPGVLEFSYSVSSRANEHGLLFSIDGLPQNLISAAPDFPNSSNSKLASGELGYQTVRFNVPSGNHTFTWTYDSTNTPVAGLSKAFIDNIVFFQGATGLNADRNRERHQGQFIVESNFITNSSVRGINVQPGASQGAGGGVPHPGSLINFPQTNAARLIPGVVIQNNVVVGSGTGIRFAGETNPIPTPVPFGRIINNTIVGVNGSGIGVDIVGIASPTLLNNLFTRLGTSIINASTAVANGSEAPIIRSNFFQANGSNPALGTGAINAGATGSPFVPSISPNYYLAAGSLAVDSSQAVEQDRADFSTFKQELGIADSPIIAPDRDVFGQLRIDSSGSTTGGGSSVFIDRGAVDRSDKESPYAVLLNPIDNNAADRDPNETVVHLTNPLLENFKILLGDGRGPTAPYEGTGVDGLTVIDPNNLAVARNAVSVVHNGRKLVQGVDYTLGYNSLTGILLLTPLSTLWNPTGVYTITLDNTQIQDLAGLNLRPNQSDGTTRFFILMPDVRLDYGDAPDSFKTLLVSNAARHTIQPGAAPRLGFRIDSEEGNGAAPVEDDPRQNVVASSPSPLFTTTATATGYDIEVTPASPTGGEQVTVQIGPNAATFELVAPGFAPQQGNIPIDLLSNDPDDIANDLANAIRDRLVFEGDAAVVTTLNNVVTIETFDDEDGVGVGLYTAAVVGAPPHSPIVFLKDGRTTPTGTADDVLGFLNPSDLFGTKISITATNSDPLATTAGLLDAWIDFNDDGAFDPNTEQIFTNQVLNVGPNKLTIVTPAGTPSGTRWARFRISEDGDLGPDELAIGGEVEDYLVEIIDVAPTVPVDDNFTIDEDGVLDTTDTGAFPTTLFSNDPVNGFLPPRFIVETQPTSGTLVVEDPVDGTLSGRFVYTPTADFYGEDTFTYWVSTQPEPGTIRPANVTLATVTVTVEPVNDAPLAVDHAFVALEDTPVTITADQLLVGAVGHASPQYVSPLGETYPWDESNQDPDIDIISINIDGTDYTTSSGPINTTRGSFVLNFAAGVLVDLIFTPEGDLNRDNLRGPLDPAILQSFLFTIRDNGESRDPITDAPIAGTPEEHTATATINVAPRNDAPTTTSDLVTVGAIGDTAANTAWRQFFVNAGSTAPVPTEDVTLVIPSAFLLQNDLAGSGTALDENNFINGNDAPLRITSVSINNRDASVSIDVNGNIVFVPPTNVYGDVTFTYVVTDSGVDEELDGTRTVAPRTATETVTVTLQPVNDLPVTYDRGFSFNESGTPGVDSPTHVFTAAQLLSGSGAELPSVPGLFAADLPDPFNESEQSATLRVVAFSTAAGTVDGASLLGGNGQLILDSDDGGQIRFNFINFAFTTGEFVPRADYNQRSPFAATETFQFVIEDDGETTDPQDLASTINIGRQRSAPATATLVINQTNDAPVYNVTATSFDIFERDDLGGTVISNAIINILPGPATAEDELLRQRVSFQVLIGPGLSTVPPGLMAANPTISENGTLTFFPAVDAVGTAVYVFDAVDREIDPATGQNVAGFVERRTRGTLTVNVRPVNDAPRIKPVVPTDTRSAGPDEFWSVNQTTGTITYTMKEDNTGANGVTSPYAFGATTTSGRIGLLDPYTVGPANEADSTPGGMQSLRITSFPTGVNSITTALGGTVTVSGPRDADGFATQFTYDPPSDYNSNQGDIDFFDYTFEDNSPLGEQGVLGSSNLLEGSLSRSGRAQFLLNPVNDAPTAFSIPATTYTALEDEGAVIVPGFATNIAPGPSTAGDELIDQTVDFELTPVIVSGQISEDDLFLVKPAIGADGALTFTSKLDAVGSISYIVNLFDDGADDAARGDINSTGPETITIHVRPINDQPRLVSPPPVDARPADPDEAWSVSSTGVITYTLPEDNTGAGGSTTPFHFYALQSQATGSPADGRIGLLDVFTVGPANEADATLGGSQSLRILSVEATTAMGGSVTTIVDPDGTTRFQYVPPANYNSLQGAADSFSYVVEDNASTSGGGPLGEDWSRSQNGLVEQRRSRTGRVQFVLNPVNDRPVFTIVDPSHSVLEDSGSVIAPNFATGIAAGPALASDESGSQTTSFTLVPQTPENGLFAVSPTISSNGTLTYTPAADAVGSIVFAVTLNDTGANLDSRGDLNSQGPVLITINLRPVNDAPRLNPAVVNTSLTTNAHEAWTVDSAGEITYTLAEDNTQSPGVDTPYVIDVRRSASSANRIGLLDPFTVGPANEADTATLGGSQALRVSDIPVNTDLGGTLTVLETDSNGFVTRLGYTPPANYNSLQGPNDSFTYTFEDDADGIGETYNLATDSLEPDPLPRTGRVRFIINPLNDAPDFIGAANVNVNEDSTTTATVGQTIVPNFVTNIVAGPAGADDELLGANPQTVSFTVVALSGNTPGLFAVAPSVDVNGTLTFNTNSDANGVGRFTIVAIDTGTGQAVDPLQSNTSVPREFTITVSAVNDAPSFTAGANVTVTEDSGLYSDPSPYATNVVPGPANEIADGQTVSFNVSVPTAAQSLFAVQPSISPTGFLTFTPADDAVGTVVLSVVAVDNLGAVSLPSTLTITITEVNDPPIANDFSIAIDEDNTVVVTQSELLDLATDPDLQSNPNEVLTITELMTVSALGAAVSLSSSGNVTYDPRGSQTLQALRPGQQVTDTFTYRLVDAAGASSDPATVTITVSGRNDAPVAVDDMAVLLSGESSVLRPLLNDSDVDGTLDPATLIITDQPTNGSLSVQDDGTLIYTPSNGFRGVETFAYTIGDNLGQQSAQAIVTLDVAPLPAVADIETGAFVDEAVTVDLSSADIPAGTLDFSSVVIVLEPSNGTVTILANGNISYEPNEGFVGTDSFEFTISDMQGRTSEPVTVTVHTVNSRLQNPVEFTDVNGDGSTNALDALLILNHLSRSIRNGTGNAVPVLDSDRGPNFYDASGNGLITTFDALRVINQVSRQNRQRLSGGEGESSNTTAGLLAAPEIAISSVIISTGTVIEPVATNMVAPINHSEIAADTLFQGNDEIELLAWDASEKDEDREADKLEALDVAWSDFSNL